MCSLILKMIVSTFPSDFSHLVYPISIPSHLSHLISPILSKASWFLQLMLILLVPLMVQLTCHGIPLFGPRFDRAYRMKSISVSRRSAMQLHLRMSMQPTNKRTIKLCSRNQNVFIQVNSNGVVNGTHERNSKYCKFDFDYISWNIVSANLKSNIEIAAFHEKEM